MTAVSPVRKQWRYCSLALSHRYYPHFVQLWIGTLLPVTTAKHCIIISQHRLAQRDILLLSGKAKFNPLLVVISKRNSVTVTYSGRGNFYIVGRVLVKTNDICDCKEFYEYRKIGMGLIGKRTMYYFMRLDWSLAFYFTRFLTQS